MNNLFSQPLFHITLTLVLFFLSRWIFLKLKWPLFNPVLLTIGILVGIMMITHTPYEVYKQNTEVISFWLGPSVVALGLPLYLYLRQIKAQIIRILFGMISGSLSGIISVVVIALLLGGSKEVILSLAPKSVTTPIAIEVSQEIGGIPPLTAAIVITVGIFGAMIGWQVMQWLRIKEAKAIGLAIGAASHGIGTAWIATHGKEYSAYGGLGMALNGALTALFTPWIMPWLINWLY